MRHLGLNPTEAQFKMVQETHTKFGGKMDLNKFLLLMKENRKLSDSKEELPEHTIEDEIEKMTTLKVCKSLTQQEIDEYTTTFEMFDENSCGSIKIQQFFVIMRHLGLNPTEVQLEMVKETDANFGGKIDLNKFLLLMKENRELSSSEEELPEHTIESNLDYIETSSTFEPLTQIELDEPLTQTEIEEYTATFEAFDINSCGTIKTQEFLAVMCYLNLTPTEKQLEIMQEIDSNKEELSDHKIEVKLENVATSKTSENLILKENQKEYSATIEVFDKNCCGTNKNEEFSVITRCLDQEPTDIQLEMVQDIDSKFSGEMDRKKILLPMKENRMLLDCKKEHLEHKIEDKIEKTNNSQMPVSCYHKKIIECTPYPDMFNKATNTPITKRQFMNITTEQLGTVISFLRQSPLGYLIANFTKKIDHLDGGLLDHSGSLVESARSAKSISKAEELCRAFRVFDREQSGFISMTKFRHVLTNLGERMSNEEVDEIIRETGIQNDKELDYKKLADILTEES
ncbi:uncharacterized protein LOC119688199 [Teleopsis dalmanni]|uniref:uncharacterized protein LOC119688199 n=1 Tax=Teleopsis dalmanni TaxID=139649 RepID=UPI0018CF2993|nr:uncharacterized protein LOC119688199 [Teleopsis dalmanni]